MVGHTGVVSERNWAVEWRVVWTASNAAVARRRWSPAELSEFL